jgi:peptidoglycan/xylan/chitin deacetylase (PgdA/CDA1 family)
VLLFRPPYEAHDALVDRRARAAGMLEVLWSVDAGDYLARRTPRLLAALIEARVRPGAIVLLHDIKAGTVQVVRRLLPGLRRRHLIPVSVPELVLRDPPSATQLRLGLAGCAGRVDRRRGE